MKPDEVKDIARFTLENFHERRVTTRSVQGHKNFTAWEWELEGEPKLDPDSGEQVSKEDAPLKKVLGCTLMWWDDDNKIVKNHDYIQIVQ